MNTASTPSGTIPDTPSMLRPGPGARVDRRRRDAALQIAQRSAAARRRAAERHDREALAHLASRRRGLAAERPRRPPTSGTGTTQASRAPSARSRRADSGSTGSRPLPSRAASASRGQRVLVVRSRRRMPNVSFSASLGGARSRGAGSAARRRGRQHHGARAAPRVTTAGRPRQPRSAGERRRRRRRAAALVAARRARLRGGRHRRRAACATAAAAAPAASPSGTSRRARTACGFMALPPWGVRRSGRRGRRAGPRPTRHGR